VLFRSIYSARELVPFDNHIARQGYPFRAASWSVSHDSSRWAVVNRLMSLHGQLSEESARREVASWILFVIGTGNHTDDAGALSIPLGHFRELIESADLNNFYLSLSSFTFLDWGGADKEALVELVNNIGIQARNLFARDGYLEARLVKLLAEHFSERPELVGVLRVLAMSKTDEVITSIPAELFDPSRFDEPLFKEAAVRLLLLGRHWSDVDVARLAVHVNEVLEVGAKFGFFPKFDSFLNEQLTSLPLDASLDRLLLELRKTLAASQWQAMAIVVSALNVSLKRRNSRLDNLRVWSELNLPPRLISILQT